MKSILHIIKQMAQLEWQSLLCAGPDAHDCRLLGRDVGGEQDRWLMAFACLRSYSYAFWLLVILFLYFIVGDLLSVPLSQFVQSIDGQEHFWIFWFGDRGLVALLFALSISLPVALLARFIAGRSKLVAALVSVCLLFFAVLTLRAGLSSLVFSFAIFVGLFVVYSVNGFCGRNRDQSQSNSHHNIFVKTMRWRSVVSVLFVLVFLLFSFVWYSYLPWALSLIQSYFQGDTDANLDSASLLLSHGRVVQWFVSALVFLVFETFAQMVFFHFYYKYHSRQR